MKPTTRDPLKKVLCLLALVSSAFTLGCSDPEFEDPRPEGPVCDPLGSNMAPVTEEHGLKTTLYSFARPASSDSSVLDHQATGTRHELSLYLSQIAIPNQRFDRGFVAANGLPLTAPDGSLIHEYFSFHIEGRLQLTNQDAPGPYQFALYSDDGSLLQVNTGSGFQLIVDNDHGHQAMLKISSTPVQINAGDKLPIVLDYSQSEPDYMAFMLLWRPWPSGDISDPADEDERPDHYWDSTVSPSVPRQPWLDLLSRGWKVVRPENFLLPATIAANPCSQPAPPSQE